MKSTYFELIKELEILNRVPGDADFSVANKRVAEELYKLGLTTKTFWISTDEEIMGWKPQNNYKHWKDSEEKIHYKESSLFPILTCDIEGTNYESGKNILIVTHLCHPAPGANDNLSGVVSLLDIAKNCIEKNRMNQVTLLFTYEYWGTIAYLARFNNKKFDFIISMDMVAGKQTDQNNIFLIDQMPLGISTTEDSKLYSILKSKLNTIKYRFKGENVYTEKAQFIPFMSGSDHYIFTCGCPSMPSTCINTFPDPHYHSANDKFENLSLKTYELLTSVVVDYLNSPIFDSPLWYIEGEFKKVMFFLEKLNKCTNYPFTQDKVYKQIRLILEKGSPEGVTIDPTFAFNEGAIFASDNSIEQEDWLSKIDSLLTEDKDFKPPLARKVIDKIITGSKYSFLNERRYEFIDLYQVYRNYGYDRDTSILMSHIYTA